MWKHNGEVQVPLLALLQPIHEVLAAVVPNFVKLLKAQLLYDHWRASKESPMLTTVW